MPISVRICAMAKAIPSSVKGKYSAAPSAHRKLMLEIRKSILEIVPQAEEVVSYGMPAFKYQGNIVAGILNNKDYVGYYPFSGSVLSVLKKDLLKYSQTKSALHIPLDKGISKTLLKKLIQTRISQCPVKSGKVDLSKYEKLDANWRELGLAAPARRGLVDAKILKLADLKKITESEFLKIHAIGPSARKIVTGEMKRKKISFAKSSAKKRS
jgi:uncharacterized protein YdhG (YjbR/CyaY superfamily)